MFRRVLHVKDTRYLIEEILAQIGIEKENVVMAQINYFCLGVLLIIIVVLCCAAGNYSYISH